MRLRNVYRIERNNEDNPYLKMSRFTDPFSVASNPRHNLHYIETRKVFCEGKVQYSLLFIHNRFRPTKQRQIDPKIKGRKIQRYASSVI
jgi:hypothetical protein